MYTIVISYAIQAVVAFIIFLCFFHFNSKGDGELEFSIAEKCMGCLCKTLPVTVRIFTIFGVVAIVYLFVIAWMPRCDRDDNTGVILNEPCFVYMALLDPHLGEPWIRLRKFLEEYEDDCRGSHIVDPKGVAPRRGAEILRQQSAISLLLIFSQLLLGFAASTKLRPPAWLWDPVPKNEGFVKKILRKMGP
jgi:hypothetical protein